MRISQIKQQKQPQRLPLKQLRQELAKEEPQRVVYDIVGDRPEVPEPPQLGDEHDLAAPVAFNK